MAISQPSATRNRLLFMLAPDELARLAPDLERVPLSREQVVIAAGEPISHVYFPESAVVSTVADTGEGRIEVGLIGREGVVGLAVALGADSTPHTSQVQGAGEALRIAAPSLRAALARHAPLFRPLGLFAHTLIVQLAQTAYSNAAFTIEARLARWILMMQDRTDGDDLLLTHEFLSAMLGVRRPGVTVATHALEGMGAIRALRGRILVRDREMLKELAGDAYQVAEAEYARVMAQPRS